MPENSRPSTIGKYQILDTVVQNSDISLYKAKAIGVAGFEKRHLVAVANTELSSDPFFTKTLLEEARKTVSLSHANVAQVLDLGQDERTSQYFLGFEYVSGITLGELLAISQQMGKPVPTELSILIATEIAKGLDYAHRRKSYEFENLNIVHGDIRPSNVIISFDGTVKLSFFGIGHALSATKLRNGDWDASFIKYFAPEVARTGILTQSGDIFSLGLIFYELLSGLSPYVELRPEVAYEQVVSASIPSLSRLGKFPRELIRILELMLVPNPSGRVESAATVFEEFVGYTYNESIKVEARLLVKYLSEIGVSRHRRSMTRPSDIGNVAGAFSLLPTDSSGERQTIRTHHLFDSNSTTLPSWLEEPLVEICAHGVTPQENYVMQVVLVADEPEPHAEYATDHWARLLQEKIDDPGYASLHDICVVQTLFHADSRINPATDFIEQFIYPMAEFVNAANPVLDAPVDGFERRYFSLDLLEHYGFDQDSLALLRDLWISGYPSNDLSPSYLHHAINDAILFCIDLLQRVAKIKAFVWFATSVELVDSLSLLTLGKLSKKSISRVPIFTVLTTSDEALVYQTMVREQSYPDRLHSISVRHPTSNASLPQFKDLTSEAQELLLILTLWDKPISFGELLSATSYDEEYLSQLLDFLDEKRWIRLLHNDRYATSLPESLLGVLSQFTPEKIAAVATQLRNLYSSSLRHPSSQNGLWEPTDVFWPRIHAMIGEPSEMIKGVQFIGRTLEAFGLYGILSNFYFQVDKFILDSRINIPYFRNRCLLDNSRVKLLMLDIEKAQEQVYFLSSQSEQNQGDHVIAYVLLFHGTVAFLCDKIDLAIDFQSQAAAICQVRHNPAALTIAYLFQAIAHFRIGHLSQAIRLHRNATNLIQYYNNEQFSSSLIAHTAAYGVLFNYCYEDANFALEQLDSLEIIARQTKDPIAHCYLLYGRAVHYFASGNYVLARETLLESARTSSIYNLHYIAVLSLFGLIHVTLLERNFDDARHYCKRASLLSSRAPESVFNILICDYQLLTDLVDPNYKTDPDNVSSYLTQAFARAKALDLSPDIKRLEFIANFAPSELLPQGLTPSKLSSDEDPISQLIFYRSSSVA